MTITEMVQNAYATAIKHGFWDDPPEFGTSIALIHSELSEALGEVRAGRPALYFPCNAGGMCCEETDKNTSCGSRVWDPRDPETYCKAKSEKPEGWAVELADAVIWIADLCGFMGIDLEEIIKLKMDYNEHRSYLHGKKF